MGSDWAVTTANPLEQIEVAVRRVNPSIRDNAPFVPEQALPVRVALDAFTSGSAFVNHDDDAGVIAVRNRADLAILDRNVLVADPATIADAHVSHTIVAGHVGYE